MGPIHSNKFRYLNAASAAFAVFVFSAFLLLMPTKARASHIVGGEITFECLGNNQYRIILDVYRDCFYGDPTAYFDDPARVGIFNDNNFLVQQVNMPFTGQDDTLSAIFSDPCLFDPGDVCVHTTRYEKVVTLPPISGGYKLVYQRCCRNLWMPKETLWSIAYARLMKAPLTAIPTRPYLPLRPTIPWTGWTHPTTLPTSSARTLPFWP